MKNKPASKKAAPKVKPQSVGLVLSPVPPDHPMYPPSFIAGDWLFGLDEDNKATLVEYLGDAQSAVLIPEKIDGYPVEAIGIDLPIFPGTALDHPIDPPKVLGYDSDSWIPCDWNTTVTSLTIPDGVKKIGKNAFSNCVSLNSIRIPDSVVTVEKGIFRDCFSLTNISIGSGVTSIATGDWHSEHGHCAALTSIDVASSNPAYRSIDGVLFDKDVTTLIAFPLGKAGHYDIPDSVTSIADNAFCHCKALTSVRIADSVIGIGKGAFHSCSALTQVSIGSGVTGIVTEAFSGIFGFGCCAALTSIDVASSNPAYRSIDGVLFDKDVTTLIAFPPGKAGHYDIPDSVTSIADNAFYQCRRLTSVSIPQNVTAIGRYAFNGCVSLTTARIPEGVISIGKQAFSDCISLTGVAIPDSVTTIENFAFSGCDALDSLTIPQRFLREYTLLFGGASDEVKITLTD